MNILFDKYSYKAIHLPTLLILSSTIINFYIVIIYFSSFNFTNDIIILSSPNFKIISGLIPILLYFFGLVVIRTNGRKLQQKLTLDWNGLPSTRFLRYQDSKFSKEMKDNLRSILKTRFNITLLNEYDENEYPEKADNEIIQSVDLIKDWIRRNDENKFWQLHNIDFGFYRNLLGSIKILYFLNIVYTIVSLIFLINTNLRFFLFLLIFNFAYLIVSFILSIKYLPNAVKYSAERYAETILTSFYNLNSKNIS